MEENLVFLRPLGLRLGLSLTRWLRDRSNVPIIMLTARRGEVDRIAGLELGADDYVVKPVRRNELLARLDAVMGRKELNLSGGADVGSMMEMLRTPAPPDPLPVPPR